MSNKKQKIPPSKLGRQIVISPKAIVFHEPPMVQEHFVDTVSILIGIGKDNHAELRMDLEALAALQSGEEISIETLKEYKKQMK
jgi:hypothetical protein